MAKLRKIRDWLSRIVKSGGFHNALVFLIFVVIATVFWLVITLNDSVTDTFRIKFRVDNVPDSVTFITDPPHEIHVTLRDKGTNILRSGVMKNPTVNVNFRDYAHSGVFRLGKTDLSAAIKQKFGSGVQITSIGLDSLRLYYTTEPGKRVPVVVRVDISAASGYIISGPPVPVEKSVKIYSVNSEIDTVNHVYTERLVKRNLSATSYFDVKVAPIANVRIIPSVIRVEIPVEPLVRKEGFATVTAENVPEDESLLLFPAKVPVEYYVPMSIFSDETVPVEVSVDYMETKLRVGNKLAVKLKGYPEYVVNPELKTDSVEYTLVRK